MNAAVVGHASLDRALIVNRCPAPGMTGVVLARPTGGRRRTGGVAQTCYALSDSGFTVWPVTCVGSDALGDEYRESLIDGGCRIEGVAVVGDRSPASDLLYAGDGTSSCLFDPGTSTEWVLTDQQAGLISEAAVVVIMIAPAPVTSAALDIVSPDSVVAWVLKDDATSLSGDLPRRLADRADIIIFNRHERHLLDDFPPKESALMAETQGAGPIRYGRGALHHEVPVPQIKMPIDATGSGDALAGGLISAAMSGASDLDAVRAGVERAAAVLTDRHRREG